MFLIGIVPVIVVLGQHTFVKNDVVPILDVVVIPLFHSVPRHKSLFMHLDKQLCFELFMRSNDFTYIKFHVGYNSLTLYLA